MAPRVLGRLIARWSSRRPAPDAASPWRDLLDALAGDACPACRRAGSAEERFRFAFLSESYTDPGVVADLSASRGFCPEHTRLLLRELEASWVLPGVYRTVVEAVLERWTRRPGEPPAGRCPICASRAGAVESWLRAFLLALEDRVVQRAYEGSAGLCVTHARAALALARGDAAKRIAEVLAGRLERRPGTADFAFPLAGPDPDAPVRAVLRSRLAGISARLAPCEEHRPLREGLAARLAVDACPVCLGGGLGERRALAWLAARSCDRLAELATDGIRLCARHLRDVASDDPPAGARLLELERTRVLGELAWLAERLGERRRARREGLAIFARAPACFVCGAATELAERERALLRAALRDRRLAAQYAGSHGVCLAHAGAIPDETVRRGTAARLALIHWELEEVCRKSAWPARFEAPRSEGDAWIRAPALLDGRVYLGAPATRLGLNAASQAAAASCAPTENATTAPTERS